MLPTDLCSFIRRAVFSVINLHSSLNFDINEFWVFINCSSSDLVCSVDKEPEAQTLLL